MSQISSIEEMFNEKTEQIIPNLKNASSDSFNWFSNISWTTWLIIILILAFFGINIFVYLAKGTQTVSNLFAPLTQTIVSLFSGTTAKTINVSAKGTQEIVNVSSNTATAGLTEIQNITGSGSTPDSAIHHPDIMSNNTLNQALNTSTSQHQQQNGEDYIADDANSSIQQGKMGWCFIGEDRGFRSCEKVGINDTCMSGDIFPTKDVCVNPNLRA